MIKDSSRLRSFAKDVIGCSCRNTITFKGHDYVVSFDYTGDDEVYDDDGCSPFGLVVFTPDRDDKTHPHYSLGWAYAYYTENGKIVDFDYNSELEVA